MTINPQFGPFWARLTQIWAANFFSENLYNALQIVHRLTRCKKKSDDGKYEKLCDRQTDGRLKEWKTLDKRSVQLIPANGKQSDNKGQTSSATDGQTELVT